MASCRSTVTVKFLKTYLMYSTLTSAAVRCTSGLKSIKVSQASHTFQRHRQCCVTSYLGNRLYRAYVGVRSEQNVLQLRLFLIDSLDWQPLWIFLCLFHGLVFKEGLLEMTQLSFHENFLAMQSRLQQRLYLYHKYPPCNDQSLNAYK